MGQERTSERRACEPPMTYRGNVAVGGAAGPVLTPRIPGALIRPRATLRKEPIPRKRRKLELTGSRARQVQESQKAKLGMPVAGNRKSARRGENRDRGSLMNVGRRVEYALRALCYLAGQPRERVVSRNEIESHQAVPPHFLSKILRALVEAGILTSSPGAHGGFRLARSPEVITFRNVFEAVEGRLSLTECARRGNDACGFVSVCTQRGVWLGAQRALLDYLEHTSIAQIADAQGLVPRARRTPRGENEVVRRNRGS